MSRSPRLLQFAACTLTFALSLSHLIAQAPAPPASAAADTAAAQALDLFNAGKTKEAADAYSAIIKNFPTASVVFEAQFRLAYIDYLDGNYDKSIAGLKKLLGPPALPEI